MFTAVNGCRPRLIRLRGDFICEQSTYLIGLLWGAGGRGGGTEAGHAASLITIDIATQKKRGTGGEGGGREREKTRVHFLIKAP